METDRITVKMLLLAAAVVALIEVCAHHAAAAAPVHPLIATGLARLLEIFSLAAIALRYGGGMASLGLGRTDIAPGILRGFVWSSGFALVALAAGFFLIAFGIDPVRLVAAPLPELRETRAAYVLIGTLIAPPAEEMFFRGIIYGFFRRWGIVAALAASTIIFIAAHTPGCRIPLTQVVGGVVFALAYEYEGKLTAPIIIHILGNGALFALAMVSSV